MSNIPDAQRHIWYTPAEIAAWLDGKQHGKQWRARCPVHGGDNASAMGIAQGRDRQGNPMTLLHCFAHQCAIEDICAALGIEVRNLFCVHPLYARNAPPRGRSPRISRLAALEIVKPDDIAQVMLEEMIVSDPDFIQTCAPARAKTWELASRSAHAKAKLTQALHTSGIHPARFLTVLEQEQGDNDATHGS
jgi:hypothetical protein